MKIGIATNVTWHGVPIIDLAQTAEALGFESLWMGEHIAIPVDIANPVRNGVMLPESYRHMPDPFIWLTAAAVSTTRLKFGTDVCLLPQRDTITLAKQVACLDHISGGRFILGVGTGWIVEEAGIMGYPFKQRWAKTVEQIRALKALWTEETPSFTGEHVSFPPVYSYPKPLQKPHPPVLIGAGNGNSDNTKIIARVAEVADGWLPVYMTPDQARDQLAQLKEQCTARGRDFSKLDITLLTPAVTLGVGAAFASYKGRAEGPADAKELIAAYEAAGVTRLLVGLVDMTPDTYRSILETAAKGLGLQ